MDDRVLAEGPGRIALGGSGERSVLSIADETTLCIAVETAALGAVLDGVPIQLSANGSHCRIEAHSDRVRFDFALAGAGRGFCLLRPDELADALAWVRDRPEEKK